jgi:hypothetical protein
MLHLPLCGVDRSLSDTQIKLIVQSDPVRGCSTTTPVHFSVPGICYYIGHIGETAPVVEVQPPGSVGPLGNAQGQSGPGVDELAVKKNSRVVHYGIGHSIVDEVGGSLSPTAAAPENTVLKDVPGSASGPETENGVGGTPVHIVDTPKYAVFEVVL